MKVTQSIILAGGNSNALNVFENIKPLIKVADKPLIVWTIERLEKAGMKDILIVTDVDTNLLHREVLLYCSPKANVHYLHEKKTRTILDTFSRAAKEVTGPVIVTMCDLIFDGDPVKPFLSSIRSKDDVALLVSNDPVCHKDSGATGKIFYTDTDTLVALKSDIPCVSAVEASLYYFSKKGLRHFSNFLEKNPGLKTYSQALTRYNAKAPVRLIEMKNRRWYDINTPATLIRAEMFLRNGDHKTPEGAEPLPKTQRLPETKRYLYNKDITFDVNIKRGLLDHLEDFEIIPYGAFHSPHFVIVDKNIDKKYGEPICKKLRKKGYHINKLVVDPGEWTKGIETYIDLVNKILTLGIDKKSVIISVGGGVIKDLSGFIASTLYRGIGFIAIPTTVLSQCDAAITPKQGINGSGGKNLIGSYHAPIRVVVDPAVLKTLSRRFTADGLAECLKQSFAQDKRFYKFFESYKGDLVNIDFLEKAIRMSIDLKIDSFQKDLPEEKEALVNQYGHEVGHAVEFLSGFTLGHGESVAIGMRVSAEIAHILGIANEETRDAHIALITKYELPVSIPANIKVDDVLTTLRYHKKSHSKESRIVLVDRIGRMWHEGKVYTKAVSEDVLREALERAYVRA